MPAATLGLLPDDEASENLELALDFLSKEERKATQLLTVYSYEGSYYLTMNTSGYMSPQSGTYKLGGLPVRCLAQLNIVQETKYEKGAGKYSLCNRLHLTNHSIQRLNTGKEQKDIVSVIANYSVQRLNMNRNR